MQCTSIRSSKKKSILNQILSKTRWNFKVNNEKLTSKGAGVVELNDGLN
jgi:hypothetical protein